MPDIIRQKKVLAVEGKDEVNFFHALLEYVGITDYENINQFSYGKPKIGIFIMPGNSDTGMLEDLCLETVKDHPAMECVNTFIDCVSKLESPPNNLAKAKAQAFLAAMLNIVNSVGVAAQKQYWDFDSEVLTEIKTFLENLK
jgi:hypothetical protein